MLHPCSQHRTVSRQLQRLSHKHGLSTPRAEQVAESSSALFGAYAFDGLRMGVRSVALLMAGISGVICCPWMLYAWCHWPRQLEAASQPLSPDIDTESDVEQQGLLSSQQ